MALLQSVETDAATTLHPTLFKDKTLVIKQLQDVGCLSALHSPYILLTLSRRWAGKLKNVG